jgi:hypothetical protein
VAEGIIGWYTIENSLQLGFSGIILREVNLNERM